MAALTRRALSALTGLGLLGGALLSSGCDLGALAYFLMPDARQPALIKNLGSDDKKKDPPKVVIVAHKPFETKAEFIHADRQLSELLGKQLATLCESNGDKISIVPQRKVEEFKNHHPEWKRMDLAEIGRTFGADYVIYLEINSLGLYEKGSNLMFRGSADLTVSLTDVKNPDEGPEQQPFVCTYPSEARGGVPVDLDTNAMQFRQQFLAYVAKRLAWHFERYPPREGSFVE